MNFSKTRAKRREYRNITSRMRGGDLQPIKAHRLMGGESGTLREDVFFDFDPVAGRIITPVTCELTAVYVPLQAIDLLANPEEPLAGSADSVRQKLLSGVPVCGVEIETELSKACGVTPRSVNGDKVVSTAIRLGHNAAVNYLRRRKYVKATQLLADSTAITPALIGDTILDRFNAVLDPEDRVNGAVQFEGEIPVHGLGSGSGNITLTNVYGRESGGEMALYEKSMTTDANHLRMREDPENPGFPKIVADLGYSGSSVSLTDFYQAERMDALVREARQMVENNPEYGEQMVAEWAHGLSVDPGKQPFVLYQRSMPANKLERMATDGPNLDESQTDMMLRMSMTVPLPRTEFGGMIIVFASIKPDETLSSQPHPFLTEEWVPMNFAADELAIDPVPVHFRELDADVIQADEGNVAFYVGNNHMRRSYINYGFSRDLDRTTVARKTAVWQLEIPMSVTPETVMYPEDLDHYPWVDFSGDVCTVQSASELNLATPIVFGPTPVEELAAIEDLDIFEDNGED